LREIKALYRLFLDGDEMDAHFLTKAWTEVPGQVLAVIDRSGTKVAYPSHLTEQGGDIPIEFQVPQVRCLDDGLEGCKGVCPVGASCKYRN
jgi:hypothetical protein